MKKLLFISLLSVFIQLSFYAQNVGINATGAAPDNSSILDVVATDKGILIPRVNIANLATAAPITSPANSLLVYNTNTTTGEGYYFWDGTKWSKLLDSNANSDEDWYKATTTNAPTSINDDIFTNGKVGIGLNNPSQALDINTGHVQVQTDFGIGRQIGDAGNEHIIYPTRTGINTMGQYGSLAPTDLSMTLESDHIIGLVETDGNDLVGWFNVNQDEFIWDGKIGIGTDVPGAQLTIKGDARIRLDNNINNQWDLNVDNTNGKFAIEQLTNFVSDGNRIVIMTNGKVGIGQNTPTHRLEVRHNIGEFSTRIFNTQDAAGNGLIIESNGGSGDDTLLFIRGDLNGTPADKFIVVGDGRVGINHSTPNTATKLDVNGYMIGQNFFFSAYSSNTLTAFAGGVVPFADENDPHNDFASNTYTAPVNGYYFFSTNITFDGGNGTDDTYEFEFLKNGISTNRTIINPQFLTRSGDEMTQTNTAIIQLNAGDQVKVNIGNVDATIMVNIRRRNFMGYMISK